MTTHNLLLTSLVLATHAGAATSFVVPDGFATDASAGAATWDIFTTADGPQGAGTPTGINSPSSSDLVASILVNYAPFAGILGGGDSYYTHDGAISLTSSATFDSGVDFARVSYSLVASDTGSTSPFPVAPSITGATPTGSGSYFDGVRSEVFYYDFALLTGTTSVQSTFGDIPQANSSFRSLEAVRIEGLSFQPTPVPESSAAVLLALSGLGLIARRRR